MATYPQDSTDWVGKGWHEPTPHTKMTVHEGDVGEHCIFLFYDINGCTHMLTAWEDGDVTFHWNIVGYLGSEPPLYTGPIDPHLLKLAYSLQEYLDAAVEKE